MDDTRLQQLMRLVTSTRNNIDPLASISYPHRLVSVRWIISVSDQYHFSSFTRDSAIQILDAYMSIQVAKKNQELLDSTVAVAHAAVVALTLGFKLHETKRTLHLHSFRDFDTTKLKEFEVSVLSDLCFSLNPQITPSAFIHEFLDVWHPVHAVADLKTDLAREADRFMAEFWEEVESSSYASSTMAIAALILAFSILHMDCAEWLALIPNCCLPLSDNYLIASSSQQLMVRRLFDVDACLVSFSKIPSLRATSPAARAAETAKLNPFSPRSTTQLLSPIAMRPVNSTTDLSSQGQTPIGEENEKKPYAGLVLPPLMLGDTPAILPVTSLESVFTVFSTLPELDKAVIIQQIKRSHRSSQGFGIRCKSITTDPSIVGIKRGLDLDNLVDDHIPILPINQMLELEAEEAPLKRGRRLQDTQLMSPR